MIKCSKCKNMKTTDEMTKEPSKKNGLHSWCKACRLEYTRAYYKKYYQDHKEICNKKHREYYKRIKEEKKGETK